jgi:arylsulfatase A-like enzyme
VFDFFSGYNSQQPHWLGEQDRSPYRTDVETDEAMAFLGRNAGRPFSLTVSYYPPHNPYVPPERFVKLYAGKALEPVRYYAACTAVDWNVGRLLDSLETHKLAANTMVIFTSDHGETFGRRLLSVNKRVGYEESARVPLLLRWPDRLPAGKVFQGGVSTMDVMPTMLDAAGIAIPSRVQARSRLPQIASGKMEWSEPVFEQNITQPKLLGGPHDERMVRMREWKLILRKFRNNEPPPELAMELYNLAGDPGQRADLSLEPASAPRIRELAGLMLDWGKRIADPIAVELAQARLKA